MSISERVLLRYRSEGHLRFDLPPELCEPNAAQALVRELRGQEGVYRVDLASGGRKLSIRYLTTVCDFSTVASRLRGAIQSQDEAIRQPSCCSVVANSPALPPAIRTDNGTLGDWLKSKLQELRETAVAMKIMLGRFVGSGNVALQRPRWIKEFMNDLLMLYLIKLHWHHITAEWIPRPWTHRYEWAATIYLIYLSVQSRLPQNAQA